MAAPIINSKKLIVNDEKDFKKFDKLEKGLEKFVIMTEKFQGKMYPFKPDYYKKESAINYMDTIKIKTLIVNAKDDPILSERCYPKRLHEMNSNISVLYPKYGGHVGFANFNTEYYWIDYKILKFINKEDGDENDI